MTISDVRRQNLQLLIEKHGSQAALARATKKPAAFIAQLRSGIRNLGEAASRDIEKSLGLSRGWFDEPRNVQGPPSTFPEADWNQLSPDARRLVLAIVDHLRTSSQQDEMLLLEAFRACSPEARAVVLSVAKAQANQLQPERQA